MLKETAKDNFANNDYALRLYNKTHGDKLMLAAELQFPSTILQVDSKKQMNIFTWRRRACDRIPCQSLPLRVLAQLLGGVRKVLLFDILRAVYI